MFQDSFEKKMSIDCALFVIHLFVSLRVCMYTFAFPYLPLTLKMD